jgi:hypothetical protein
MGVSRHPAFPVPSLDEGDERQTHLGCLVHRERASGCLRSRLTAELDTSALAIWTPKAS